MADMRSASVVVPRAFDTLNPLATGVGVFEDTVLRALSCGTFCGLSGSRLGSLRSGKKATK